MNSTNSTSHDSDSAPSPQVGSPPPPVAPPPSPQSSPPPPPPESNASPPPPKSPTPSSNDSNASAPPPTSNTSRPSTPDTVPPPPPSHRASHSSKALSPPPPASSSSGSNSESSGGSGSSSEHLKISVGVSVGIGLFVIAMILLCVFCKKKRKRHHLYLGDPHAASGYYKSPPNPTWPPAGDNMGKLSPGGMAPLPGWHPQPPPSSGDMSSNYGSNFGSPLPPISPSLGLGFNKSTFTYEELATATGGFAQENVLGQGGFGYVHKGLLPNGKEIAVKSLKSGSGQGEREFQAEVDIISRVHHRYLVSLVGYCIAGGQRMLVYEFVSNKTLEHHLHDKGLTVMDWPTRLKIAMGSAKGLAYLHEDCHPRIIHRDIKSANILLDYNFEAKVADFGLAKLNSDNYTHVSTRVMGTFGYLAPEYASSGKLTEKSDVFSFGVMLLELITGKKPVDPTRSMEDGLVDWARPLLNRALEERKYDELVDFRLENNYNPQEMHRMVACAAASIRHSAKKRPKMSQIVRALEGDVSLEHLNEGIRPGQSSALGGGNFSSDYDASAYNADMEKFRQVAFASLEFSGDHGT